MTAPLPDALALAARLTDRDLGVAPAVLNLLENRSPAARREAIKLVAALSPAVLGKEAPAHIIGLTGPPGVGKSSLLSRLLAQWRARGRTVAVLAVDPSSRRSGGSLLGDRARIEFDPSDRGVFVRSSAAGERLGGIAAATRTAAGALAVAFDVVVIETVGVGQSETEVADVADTVVVVVQPGSGDVLQFLKAGIMEVPDVLVVSKSDLGPMAARALEDVRAALGSLGAHATPVLAVSAVAPAWGIEALVEALEAHRAGLDLPAHRAAARRTQALTEFLTEHGELALRAIGGRRAALRWLSGQPAGRDVAALVAELAGLAALDHRNW